MFHKDVLLGDAHFPHSWEYANAAARLAATGFVSTDVKKIALQLDTNTFYLLTAITPTWSPVGASVSIDPIWDTAGDLVVGTGADTAAKLPIGTAHQVLRTNGTATGLEWVDPTAVSSSAVGGTDFYFDSTPIIPAGAGPQTVPVETLLLFPSAIAESVQSQAVTAQTLMIADAYMDGELGVTSIPAGQWEFHLFRYVSSATGLSELLSSIYTNTIQAGTVTITGAGTSRTATITGGTPFLAGDANALMEKCSWIQTPNGQFRITAFTSSSIVTIECLTTYTNEAGVAYYKDTYAFNVTTGDINDLAVTEQVVPIFQSAITVLTTSKIVNRNFAKTDSGVARTIYFVYGGTVNYSHIHSPVIVRHNGLSGIQGGAPNDYVHLSTAEKAALPVSKALGSDVNTGTNDTKFVTPLAIAESTVMIPKNLSIPITGLTGGAATITLTAAETKATSFEVSGVLSDNIVIIVADTMPLFLAENICTVGSGFTVTFKTAAGTGIVVADGIKAIFYANGTNVEDHTDLGGGAAISPSVNGFRLTLTTAVPVTTANVTGATTIYCSPYKGNEISLYSGTAWVTRTSVEFSLVIGTLTVDLPYDVFCYDNSSVPTLEFLAWTNITTRATALAMQDGILCKSGATTRRYLGTFYTKTATTTEDSVTHRYLWNYYHRIDKSVKVYDATATWTYTTFTLRQARASTANQFNFVVGVAEDATNVTLTTNVYNSSAGARVYGSIGYDSTSVEAAETVRYNVYTYGVNMNTAALAIYNGVPAVGKHYLSWLEISSATGTSTWGGATINGLSGVFKC